MKYQTTGIILASGEGSRVKDLSHTLGVPKHLFTIGKSTIAGRAIAELYELCATMLIITHQKDIPLFETECAKLNVPATIVAKEGNGFRGDFQAIALHAQHEHFVLTVGDLIFPDKELLTFGRKACLHPQNCYLGLDQGQMLKADLRIVCAALNKTLMEKLIELNPESFKSVLTHFFRNFFSYSIRPSLVNTLFNINTAAQYLEAKTYFERQNL